MDLNSLFMIKPPNPNVLSGGLIGLIMSFCAREKDKQPAIKKESIDKMVAGWLSILSSLSFMMSVCQVFMSEVQVLILHVVAREP